MLALQRPLCAKPVPKGVLAGKVGIKAGALSTFQRESARIAECSATSPWNRPRHVSSPTRKGFPPWLTLSSAYSAMQVKGFPLHTP
jgi:hypothetical protein